MYFNNFNNFDFVRVGIYTFKYTALPKPKHK